MYKIIADTVKEMKKYDRPEAEITAYIERTTIGGHMQTDLMVKQVENISAEVLEGLLL